MKAKQIVIGLAALTAVAGGYITAEISYQKEKDKCKLPHMGNKKDFKIYQERFMDADNEPIMSWRDRYFYGRDDTLVAHVYNSIRKKTNKLKYKNAPKEDSDNNLLFGTFERQDFGLTLNNRKSNRNADVLTIGYNAKDRTDYIKTNIMQENSSAMVVDPHGKLYGCLAPCLIAKGYPVYLFNPFDAERSNHYNPLEYVYDEKGHIDVVQINTLVDLCMKISEIEYSDEESFWMDNKETLLKTLIYYVLENDDISKQDKCFSTVLEKARMLTDNEEAASLISEMNTWYTKMDTENKKYKSKPYYDIFVALPRKTVELLAVQLVEDLMFFADPNIDRITRTNEECPVMNIDFSKLFSQQGYLFVEMTARNKSYNFLFSALYWQFYSIAYKSGERIYRGKYHIGYREGLPIFDSFDTLNDAMNFKRQVSSKNIIENDYLQSGTKVYDLMWKNFYGITRSYKTCLDCKTLKKYANDLDNMVIWNGDDFAHGDPALPVHVNVYLSDFTNCGYIPNFLTFLATSRKYRIGTHCLVSDIQELKKIYTEDECETIKANVDTVIYFGSDKQSSSDMELVHKLLGKTTILPFSHSRHFFGGKCYSVTEVDLMTLEEIREIGNSDMSRNADDREIVMVRDCYPFICRKYNPKNHKRYDEYKNAYKKGKS